MSSDEAAQVAKARETIERLVAARGANKTICPSDAARDIDEVGFRLLMPLVRRAAAELQAKGVIEVTQGGEVVDLATAEGPVRLGRPRSG